MAMERYEVLDLPESGAITSQARQSPKWHAQPTSPFPSFRITG
jgi:hypothetical protein